LKYFYISKSILIKYLKKNIGDAIRGMRKKSTLLKSVIFVENLFIQIRIKRFYGQLMTRIIT